MKALWYFVTFVLGLLGMLYLLRGLEILVTGGADASTVVQLALAVVLLFGAWKSVKKARAA